MGLLILIIIGHSGDEKLETTMTTLEEGDKGESTSAPSWTNLRRKEQGRKYHQQMKKALLTASSYSEFRTPAIQGHEMFGHTLNIFLGT